LKNCVPTSRSDSSSPETRATDGIEKMTISEVTSVAQTKIGIRANVIPGARCLRMVATRVTATASPAISVKVMVCAQASERLPMPYCGPDSGT
jgi:hypothetical protein